MAHNDNNMALSGRIPETLEGRIIWLEAGQQRALGHHRDIMAALKILGDKIDGVKETVSKLPRDVRSIENAGMFKGIKAHLAWMWFVISVGGGTVLFMVFNIWKHV